MSETPMSPERLAEIRAELEHVTQLAAEATGWRPEDYRAVCGALHYARLLAAEVDRQRAELTARPSRAEVLAEAADAVECFDYPSAGALDEPGVLEQVELAERVQRALAAELRAMADGAGKDTPAGGESTEPAELTVYRAEHDSIVMGLYTTAEAARAHCEAEERLSWSKGSDTAFDWIEDDEDGVAELTAWVGGEECETGYVVTALTVASKYDPEAGR